MGRPSQSRPLQSRRWPWVVAVVLWTAFVWGHSLMSGPESTAESNFVMQLVRPLFLAVGVTQPDLMTFVIRKAAHFSEYAVLGLLLWRCARGVAFPMGHTGCVLVALVALSYGLAVPLVDELVIQARVPGRSSSLRDVAIDVSGLAVACALCALVARGRGRGYRGRHLGAR